MKKARVKGDLGESCANKACDRGERIILPHLLDVVSSLLAAYRGLHIRAFMNIPAGRARRFSCSCDSPQRQGKYFLVVFNTLVFGSDSSPTEWGRMAAWLGRTTATVTLAARQC